MIARKKKLQHLFEEAIKDIQQKESPRDLPKASIQTQVKANLTKNFGSDTKNQFSRPTESTGPTSFINFIGSTKPIRFINSTRSTNATKFTSSTKSIGNINVTKTIGSF